MPEARQLTSSNPSGTASKLQFETDLDQRFSLVLEDAERKYKGDYRKALRDLHSYSLRSIDDLKAQLIKQNDKFSEFRDNRKDFFDLLDTVLQPVQLVGGIVAGVASEFFPPSQTIFASILSLFKAAQGLSSEYDSITKLLKQLTEFTSRLNLYLKEEISDTLYEKIVEILTTLFEILVVTTIESHRGRLRGFLRKWAGRPDHVAAAITKLENLTMEEEKVVHTETHCGVNKLIATTNSLMHLNRAIDAKLPDLTERNMRELLAPAPLSESSYNDIMKKAVPKTGDWILDDTKFKAWLGLEFPLLWITGNAGTGKSYLTARMISHCEEKQPPEKNVAYFFFKSNNSESRSVLQALCTVAYQLTENDDQYARILKGRLSSREEIKTVGTAFQVLFNSFSLRSEAGRTKYIFFDGIDEADTDEVDELLSALAPYENPDPANAPFPPQFRFALVGQTQMTDKVTSSCGSSVATLHVTTERNAKDVAVYIRTKLKRALGDLPQERKRDVIQTVQRQADGLFLVAKLMIDEVGRCCHLKTILETLRTYPKGVTEALHRTLASLAENTFEDRARDLNEVLRWVTCAEQALTLEQLEAVIMMQSVDPPISFEESMRKQFACFFVLQREDALTTDDLLCGIEGRKRSSDASAFPGSEPRSSSRGRSVSRGELSVMPPNPSHRLSNPDPSSLSRDSSRTRTACSPSPRQWSNPVAPRTCKSNKSTTSVSFFHSTVGDFFQGDHDNRIARAESSGVTVGFNIQEARLHILRTCLNIFLMPEWFSGLDLGPGKMALKRYAARYWQEHCAAVDPANLALDDYREILRGLNAMLTDEHVLLDWTQLYDNDTVPCVLSKKNILGLLPWFSRAGVVGGLSVELKRFATEAEKNPALLYDSLGRLFARIWSQGDSCSDLPALLAYEALTFNYIGGPDQLLEYADLLEESAFLTGQFLGREGLEEDLEPFKVNSFPIYHASRNSKGSMPFSYAPREMRWAHAPFAFPVEHRWLFLAESKAALGSYLMAGFLFKKHMETKVGSLSESLRTLSGIAFCNFSSGGDLTRSLIMATDHVEAETDYLKDETLQPSERGASMRRLFKSYSILARIRCGEVSWKQQKALGYLCKALDCAKEGNIEVAECFEHVMGYVELLAGSYTATPFYYGGVMGVVSELSTHALRSSRGGNLFMDLLLAEHSSPLVIDWIPKAACKMNQLEFLLGHLREAINFAETVIINTRLALYLQLALGNTLTYARSIKEAIALFERISFDEYRPHGNYATRLAYAMSLQKLAALYKQKALETELDSEEAQAWVKKLEMVQDLQQKRRIHNLPRAVLGSDVNTASIFLASFYHRMGRKTESRALLQKIVRDSLRILSDDEPSNDANAVNNLLCVFIAAGDEKNALALIASMTPDGIGQMPPSRRSQKTSEEEKKQIMLSNLTCRYSSCFQCFLIMRHRMPYYICRFCLESYCLSCIDRSICKPGNETGSGSAQLMCRSDHSWFLVICSPAYLSAGKISCAGSWDHESMNFADWKDMISKQWEVDQIPTSQLTDDSILSGRD